MSITERAKDMGVADLVKENKRLKEEIKRLEFDVDAWYQLKLLLEWEIERLRGELNKKNMKTWFDEKAKNIYIDKSWKVIKGWEFTTLC